MVRTFHFLTLLFFLHYTYIRMYISISIGTKAFVENCSVYIGIWVFLKVKSWQAFVEDKIHATSEKKLKHKMLLDFIDAEQMPVMFMGCRMTILVMSMWRKISRVIPAQIKAWHFFITFFFFFVLSLSR